jgi:WD40 repeat protein
LSSNRHISISPKRCVWGGLLLVLALGSAERPRNPTSASTHQASLPHITSQNAAKVSQLTRMGKGWPSRAIWATDGKTLIVESSVGMWIYSTGKFDTEPTLLEGYKEIEFNPKSSQVALVRNDNTIELRDSLTTEVKVRLAGHSDIIEGIRFSPDGATLLSFGEKDTIGIWDSRTGKLKKRFDDVRFIVFSRDISLYAIEENYEIGIWSTETGQKLVTLHLKKEDGHCWGSMVFSPNNAFLACMKYPDKVAVWEIDTGRLRHTFIVKEIGPHTEIMTLAFSPDSSLLAVGGSKVPSDAVNYDVVDAVWVWNLRSGRRLFRLLGHAWGVTDIVFSRDGTMIASNSYYDGNVLLWDAQTGKRIQTIPRSHTAGLRFSPNSRYLAIWNGDIAIWDTKTGKQEAALEGYSSYSLWIGHGLNPPCEPSLIFSSDGTQLVSGDSWNAVRLWDLQTGQRKVNLYLNGWTTSISLSRSSSIVATSVAGQIVLWDARARRKIDLAKATNLVWQQTSASFGGSTFAYIGEDGFVWLQDTLTNRRYQLQHPQEPDLPYTRIGSLAFALNGSVLAAMDEKHVIYLWNVATRTQRAALKTTGEVNTFTVSRDGKLIATWWSAFGSWGDELMGMWLWNVADGQLLQYIPIAAVTDNVVFSPDGNTVAWVGLDYAVYLWDIRANTRLAVLQDAKVPPDDPWPHSEASSQSCQSATPAFSPDGSVLAAIGIDGAIRLWDVKTGSVLKRLTISPQWGAFASGVAFSPDGTKLASVSEDGTVRLWGVQEP